MISEAAAGPHRAVRHLVYLTAAIPGSGDSLAKLAERRDDDGEEEIEPLADARMKSSPCPPGTVRTGAAPTSTAPS